MSATNVARAGKRGNTCVGNNVSAKMCPRLPGPYHVVEISSSILLFTRVQRLLFVYEMTRFFLLLQSFGGTFR